MFCTKCGSNIPEGDAVFCPVCGNTLTAPSTVERYSYTPPATRSYDPVGSRLDSRQGEIEEVNRMISYFSKVSDKYAEYERVCVALDPRNKRKRVGLLVWGIIIAVLGVMFTAASANSFSKDLPVVGVATILGGVAMIVGYIASSSARNTNYDDAYRRFNQLTNELLRYYQGYGPCLVSAEYTNPNNLVAIRDTISSGRADNIKEALNVLIDDAHRNNMEAFARQSAISSAAAARGATAAAIFSAANLFRRR